MNLKEYTVVLLYPDYLCDEVPYGQEVYVASRIKAVDTSTALAKAQREAFLACLEEEEGNRAEDSEDFALVVMFEGHHNPTLYGWQL